MNTTYKIVFIAVCLFASTNMDGYPFYHNPFNDVVTDADAAVYVQTELLGGGVTSFLTPEGNLALVLFDAEGNIEDVNYYDEEGNLIRTVNYGDDSYVEVIQQIENGGEVGPSGEGTENSIRGNEGCNDPYNLMYCDSDPFSDPYTSDTIFNVTAG